MKEVREIDLPNPKDVADYGEFVREAYDMRYGDRDNPNPHPTKNFPPGWDLFLTIQMKGPQDSPFDKKGLLKTECIGFFARNQKDRNLYVAAMRGTDISSYANL